MKVMTIVGTRPEIIKLSRVIAELERYMTHILVHTGQNYDYELNEIFFKEMEIKKPDYFLNTASGNAALTIGNVIAKSDEVMEKEAPDALLLYGDTNSCLSVISAKRRKIPVFHVEAGNRCFDQRVPEEINRKIIDHLSDINLPLTEHARRYLLAEGIKPETIIKIGSALKEVLHYYMPRIEKSDIMARLNIKPREYFLVSAHREENLDSDRNLHDLIESLHAIISRYDIPIIFSTHPRTMKKLNDIGKSVIDERIKLLKPFGYFDYIKLQMNARCVVSDSGTITEESSLLNFPAITIRQAHERPEGMDEGTLIMSGLSKERVLKSIDIVVSQHEDNPRRFRIIPDYDADNVSSKIVRIIMSYTDYINRTVWNKDERGHF